MNSGLLKKIPVDAGTGESSSRHGSSLWRESFLQNESLFPRRESVGAELLELLATATPQNSRGEFYPPGCAAEGERIAAAGENLGDSRLRGNDEVGGGEGVAPGEILCESPRLRGGISPAGAR